MQNLYSTSRFFRDFDIADSIQALRYYAGWADKITGQVRILELI